MTVLVEFNKHYQESCFEAWYSAGRPGALKRIYEVIPSDEFARKPSIDLIGKWRNELNWDIRADELDARAITKSENHLILEKAKMLKRQADTGFKLQEKGMEYLEKEGFDTASSAVSAISKGVEIERSSRGISDFILKLAKMTDSDVKDEIRKLSERVEPSDRIIDVAQVEEKEDGA
jgi:hypothetical protein